MQKNEKVFRKKSLKQPHFLTYYAEFEVKHDPKSKTNLNRKKCFYEGERSVNGVNYFVFLNEYFT